ncbi:hypothetical protein R9C00_23280 [Flammeovirgaceae bacterium SG7u.111]|nr:hypothetical protein [Flammeovirgaceae bacterium SG7u.132]WPO34629.1 hypothetical protein R9C00_23280 [Flammeovirgaceae bacterium SG7u.111]
MGSTRKKASELGQKNIVEVFEREFYGIGYKKVCYRCGKEYTATRVDSLACSTNCSIAVSRLRKRGITPALGKNWVGKEK